GTWVELEVKGEWIRAQLTWASPAGTLFMFTSQAGTAHSMSRRTLDRLRTQGHIKVIAERNVVDEALDQVAKTALKNSIEGHEKSTLLKIMAGLDTEIEGEATPMPNLRIGHLPQEPQLAPDETVRESVEGGMGEVMQAKKRLEEVYAAYAEPDADFDKLAAEQAQLEAVISASGGGDEHQLEIAADALRLPEWDAVIKNLSGGEKRRVALCRLLLS